MFSLLFKTTFAKRSYSYQNQLLSLPNISILSCVFNGLLKKSYSMNPNINDKAPFTMKLDSLEFKSLFTQALCQLADIFKENSYEIRIAGGAVRDLLLGIKPKDVDFATTATPDEMKAMFKIYNIKMINNKGEKHGTITARIDQENFEITTLRIDVTTDGRHAEVEFTTDWKIDANRRDLTINSMFLGLDGTLYDYFNGHEDVKRRKIAFVGDPEKRIKEDYLRILRYYRFYGRIATSPDNHDPECLRVIKENNEGLKRISGERIWLELQKIVIGNFAGDILKSMENVGLYPLIGLPAEPNMNELDTVLERTKNMKVHPITVIAALLANEDQMLDFHTRCKLSSYERDLGLFIIRNRKDKSGSLISYQKLIVYTKAKTQDSKEWAVELIKYKDDVTFIHDIQSWTVPRFPVSGNTLFQLGVPAGKKMGVVIDHLKLLWVDSGFKLTTEELSQKVPEILSELNITKEVKN